MQQTFTQLPPGLAPPYGQQLGLAASWLGPTPAPPPPTAQGMPQGLAAFSSMQQHVTSQLAGALPAWAAMLQPAGLPGVLPAGGPPQAPMVTSASLSLDFGAAPPAAAATAALGGGGIGGAAPGNLPGPGKQRWKPAACTITITMQRAELFPPRMHCPPGEPSGSNSHIVTLLANPLQTCRCCRRQPNEPPLPPFWQRQSVAAREAAP